VAIGARSSSKLNNTLLSNYVLHERTDIVFAEQIACARYYVVLGSGKSGTEVDREVENELASANPVRLRLERCRIEDYFRLASTQPI
jgi:hypothetical protein